MWLAPPSSSGNAQLLSPSPSSNTLAVAPLSFVRCKLVMVNLNMGVFSMRTKLARSEATANAAGRNSSTPLQSRTCAMQPGKPW